LKHFFRDGSLVRLEAANTSYDPIEIDAEQVHVQGKLAAVWRKT
jgi:repressor LexA